VTEKTTQQITQELIAHTKGQSTMTPEQSAKVDRIFSKDISILDVKSGPEISADPDHGVIQAQKFQPDRATDPNESVAFKIDRYEVELLGQHYFEADRAYRENAALVPSTKHDSDFSLYAIDRLNALAPHFSPSFQAWMDDEISRRDYELRVLVAEKKMANESQAHSKEQCDFLKRLMEI
jgi:hypothetical protein